MFNEPNPLFPITFLGRPSYISVQSQPRCLSSHRQFSWPLRRCRSSFHASAHFSRIAPNQATTIYIPLYAILALLLNMEKPTKEALRKWSAEIDDWILKRLFDTQFEDSDLPRGSLKASLAYSDHP